MTSEEYITALSEIVASGRGFKAIIDLAKMLYIHYDDRETFLRETRGRKMAGKEQGVGECGTCRYLDRTIAALTNPPQYMCVRKGVLVFENGRCDTDKGK